MPTATFIAMKQAALSVLGQHGVRLAGHIIDEMLEAQIQASRAANVARITKLMSAGADARHGVEIGQVTAL